MNFGYVKDTAGISKPINLDDILMVDVTSNSIIVRYDLKASYDRILDKAAFYIGFNNPLNISPDQIRSQFYSWFKNACNSAKATRTLLNTAIPHLEVSTAGLISGSDTRLGRFASATGQTEACAQGGSADCVVESTAETPPVGTLILAKPSPSELRSISDGSYSLTIGQTSYFITVDGSRIASIVVCPFALDFLFDPNQQANGVVDDANYFTLAYKNYRYGDGLSDYYGAPSAGQTFNDWGIDQVFTGVNDQLWDVPAEPWGCSGYLKTSNDATWPSGLIVNGYLGASDGLGQLPVFGVKLNSASADWSGAQLWVSDDYYITGDMSQATWQKFDRDYWGSGFSHFGNGTFLPYDLFVLEDLLFSYDISDAIDFTKGGRVFLPAATSINGNITFNQVEQARLNQDGTFFRPETCDGSN